MENATKALLIAAAVLIAIILIALGVSLLSSAGDTTGQAEQVGQDINISIGGASSSVIVGLQGLQGGSSSGGTTQGGSLSGFYMYLSSSSLEPKEDWYITNIPSSIKTWKNLIEYTNNNAISLQGYSVKFKQTNDGYVSLYLNVGQTEIERYVHKVGEKDNKISIDSKIVNGQEYMFNGNV